MSIEEYQVTGGFPPAGPIGPVRYPQQVRPLAARARTRLLVVPNAAGERPDEQSFLGKPHNAVAACIRCYHDDDMVRTGTTSAAHAGVVAPR